ncbi:MAG: hypothetical protein B0W54_21635 [Cellvibrio sp. 79]|nr:MAG: hypothetical protein B0W54_21635 [Cellvibrio sp. 79]
MRSKNSYLHFFFIVVFSFLCKTTHAITIDFDDLDPNDLDGYELRNEYASLGVIFEAGYLITTASGNAVTGPSVYFTFTGELPTYVSFISNNPDGLKNSATAKGPNGYEELIITEGWYRGTFPDDDRNTPYIPNQRIVFHSEFGISSIGVSSQTTPFVDYLIFHNTKGVVSEPSLAVLFILGLSGIFFKNRKLFYKK